MPIAIALLLAAAAQAGGPSDLPPHAISPLTVPGPQKPAATLRLPSDESTAGPDFVAIVPAGAYGEGTDGDVTLSCWIDVHGLAERCQVAAEQPKGKGFGKAALQLRPLIQLEPAKGADGEPKPAEMSIRIRFPAPKKFVVGTWARESEIRNLGDTKNLANYFIPQTGNPLAMKSITAVDDPVWIAAPDFQDLANAYPTAGGGVEGYAVPHCEIIRSGLHAGMLKNCDVIKESPHDHGFAQAALSLTAKFRIDAAALARAPHGAPLWVTIPIRLTPPDKLAERNVTAPVWISGIDPAAAPKVYPPEAAAAGIISGRGVARCEVSETGALTGCTPDTADPDGMGFSEAAVKLASTLKMNLWSADGAPVEGGIIEIPIRLNLKPTSVRR